MPKVYSAQVPVWANGHPGLVVVDTFYLDKGVEKSLLLKSHELKSFWRAPTSTRKLEFNPNI